MRVVRFQLCAVIPTHCYRRGWAALSATKHLNSLRLDYFAVGHSLVKSKIGILVVFHDHDPPEKSVGGPNQVADTSLMPDGSIA